MTLHFVKLLALLALGAARSAPPRTAAGGANTRLGGNVAGVAGRTFHFANLAKQALPFGLPSAPRVPNASVDDQGWPTEDFGLSMYSEGVGAAVFSWPPADISGVYTVVALGNGTVWIPPPAGGTAVLNQSYAAATNTLLAYVSIPGDPAAVGGLIEISFNHTTRDPASAAAGGGLTNISVFQPGYGPHTDPEEFADAAIANYKRFSLVRFMPWTVAQSGQLYLPDNPSPPSSARWADRARLGAPSYLLGSYGTRGPGVPWEVVARFANTVEADVWVNVPAGDPGKCCWAPGLCSSAYPAPGCVAQFNTSLLDEYVTNLVSLLDRALPAGRKIYVEFANEVWNGHFVSSAMNMLRANRSVFVDGDPHGLNRGLGAPNASDKKQAEEWGSRHMAWTSRQIALLAAKVVGKARVGRAADPGVRVVPVLGVQGNYAPQGDGMLSYLQAQFGSPAADGLGTIALGGYVSMGAHDRDDTMTVDEVIAGFLGVLKNQSTASPTAYGSNPLAAYAGVAAYYGVDLHAYEGSPDTSGSQPSQPVALAAKANATQDPRMADVVVGNIQNWQAWGGGTFNFFTAGATSLLAPWGSYSTLYDMRKPVTPKTIGIDRVLAAPPVAVSAGRVIPVHNMSAAAHLGYYSKDGLPPTSPVVTWLPQNTTLAYLVRRDPPGTPCAPQVTVWMTNRNKTTAGTLEVSVGTFLKPVTVTAPDTGGDVHTFRPVAAAFPSLPPQASATGLLAVQLTVPEANADFYLQSIDVECGSGSAAEA